MHGTNQYYSIIRLIALVLMASDISTTTLNEYPLEYSNVWDKSSITVHINDENVPPHYKPIYHEQVKKALEYWEQGGNGKLGFTLKFKQVDSDEPDISIS